MSLQVDDMKVGTGAEATAGKTVTVHYVGTLTNGSKFDSSRDRGQGFTFPLGAFVAGGLRLASLTGIGSIHQLSVAAWGLLCFLWSLTLWRTLQGVGRVKCRRLLGGLLRHYDRAAA